MKNSIGVSGDKQIYGASATKENTVLLVLCLLLVGIVLGSLTVGRYSLPLDQLLEILKQRLFHGAVSAENQRSAVVLFVVRIPRILLAMMVGACISVAGASYQGLFRNPMISPDILGASSGAATGAVIALILDWSSYAVQLLSFTFGILAVCLVLFITKVMSKSSNSLLVMILTGTVVSSIFQGITSLMKYVADTSEKLPAITYWLLGSFARTSNSRDIFTLFVVMLIGMTPLFFLRYRLNVLSFGDEEARSLGVNVQQTRYIIMSCATLMTAASVSMCGIISWIGLIIPHICRMLVGPNYRALLKTSIVMGGLFMVMVDNFARVILPGEIPIGVLTSLIGAPLFLSMLYRERRSIQ